ncbi:hypothetical protein EsDP_00001645 [Epichloe bromicola]|uniref:SWR1-complex protein 3 domain-containing protein n=1 Tax=Epichloe bromicola TaxID=79588 RepID=A0ABQ0CIG1_9HYPO
MERKRKLPPRAAARQEQAAKRRNVTTRGRSSTPAVVEHPPREPTPPPPPPTPPPPLPKSIEVGKPLPTVEEAQAADLGVLSESIARSRQKWISEGLFERFWTKPHKRKGVLQEDPNNPPKDSMMKVGAVTITIEPHIVEATMFAVKTSKLLPHQQQKFNPKPQQQSSGDAQQTQSSQLPASTQSQSQQQMKTLPRAEQSPQVQAPPIPQHISSALARPVLQYGPHNGAMPPTLNSPVVAVSAPASSVNAPPTSPQTSVSTASVSTIQPAPEPAPASSIAPANPAMSPRPEITTKAKPTSAPAPASAPASQQQQPAAGVSQSLSPQPSRIVPQTAAPPGSAVVSAPSRASPAQATFQPAAAPQPIARPMSNPPPRQAAAPAPKGQPGQSAAPRPTGTPNKSSSPALGKSVTTAGASAKPAAPAAPAKPASNDPVIALLAQKASRDPELRDLMKRVAVGEAKDGELAKFQKIIDQLNAEYRQRGGQQGPSADRLLVDGRTVKYFADEVRTILEIVLASNPNQKSSELRPPPRSDPLVVLLVKTALEDQRTKDMIRRIAEGKPGFTDATDLKQILDRLHRDAKITPKAPAQGPSPLRAPAAGVPGGPQPKAKTPKPAQQSNAQALRSKGPPPANRPDISAVVFDFGSGDRYLFPKYSVLEFLPTQSGQQVVASFLIVRKGSTSEYGGDPKLDYYQPVTIRLQTNSGRHLENLARVVAPQDEVRRYMDDVMDNMTRAEYVLLAMRLPRADFDPEEGIAAVEECKASSPTPKSEPETDQNSTPKPGVLWATGRDNKAVHPSLSVKLQDPEQEAQTKYERLIRSVAEKEVDGL